MTQLALKNEVAVASENALSGSMPQIARPIACSDGPREIEVDGKKINYTYELHSTPENKLKHLVLDGVKNLQEGIAAGFDAVMDCARQLFPRAATGIAIFGVAASAANAAEIDSLASEPIHNAMGKQPGTLWVKAQFTYDGVTYDPYYFTSFTIGELVDVNGKAIRTYMYVPAHGYAASATPSSLDSELTIGDGTNYLTAPGRILENLREEYRSPMWNPDNAWSNAGDCSVWSTTTSFGTNCVRSIAPSFQQGDIALAAGFDELSTPTDGILPDNGKSYGYNATILYVTPDDVQPGPYYTLVYNYESRTVPNNGASNSGGSGSGVVDAQNRTIGAVVGSADGSYSGTFRTTVFANFTNPAFSNQLAPYLGVHYITSSAISNIAIDGSDALITFKAVGGSNYYVQWASTLEGTNTNYIDISSAIPANGIGICTNTFRHAGALTNSAVGFYRIRVE